MSYGSHGINLWAPAKVNLTLEVIGRRADGFHEIRSVMQKLCLADRLTVAPADELVFTSSDPLLQSEENLVVRAARLLRTRFAISAGARLHLEKHVPVAAGLGGGSSDAATALNALNRLWGLGCSAADLSGLAAQLGSDVPFFLPTAAATGTALALGRGEEIVPLPALPPRWVVLILPSWIQENKTVTAFRSLAPEEYGDGRATAQVALMLHEGRFPEEDLLVNSFLGLIGRLVPAVAEAFGAMARLGLFPHLTGAGPTLFALTEDRTTARSATAALRARGWRARLTHTARVDSGRRLA